MQIFYANEISIEPKMDLTTRIIYKDTKFSTLGQILNQKEGRNFYTSTFGGDLGLLLKTDDFEFNFLGSGSFKLTPISSSDEQEPTFFDRDKNDFFYLSNLYLSKNVDDFSFKIGRQQYNNNLVGKNRRVTSNQYEGLYFDYKNDDIKFNSLFFNKIASSTLANVVPFNHNYGVIGYGKGYEIGSFSSLSKHISNKDYDSFGALVSDFKYGDNNKNINVQNLYVDNYFDTFLISNSMLFDFDNFKMSTFISYLKQFDVGENNFAKDYGNKKIDADMYQGKLTFIKDNYFLNLKYANTSYDENSVLNGTIISPFSNTIGIITATQTAHSFIADTVSKELGIGINSSILNKYTLFYIATVTYDIGDESGLLNVPLKTKENYFHTKINLSQNLDLIFQYSYCKNLDPISKRVNVSTAFLNYRF